MKRACVDAKRKQIPLVFDAIGFGAIEKDAEIQGPTG
jgi:hypothetical protein